MNDLYSPFVYLACTLVVPHLVFFQLRFDCWK